MDKINIEVEKLIQEVEIRPAIWDTTHSEYADRAKRKQRWEEIVNVFVDETSVVEEKRQMGELLQKKWKNIRDRYAREVQERKWKSGDGLKKKTPYMYTQRMKFLKDTVKNRKATTSTDESQIQGLDDTEVSSQHDTEPRTENHKGGSSRRYHLIENNRILNPVEIKLPLELGANVVHREKSDKSEEEADHYFLLSLLPSMKSIPSCLKLNARIEIMQAINKYTKYTPLIPSSHQQRQQPHLQRNWEPLVQQPMQILGQNQHQSNLPHISIPVASPDESMRSYTSDYNMEEDSDLSLL